jgi:hypothetical protein
MEFPRTLTAGSVAVAMLVFGSLSAVSASAAPEFLSKGEPLPTLVLVLNDNPQIFRPDPELEIICNHFFGEGDGPGGAMSGMLQGITGTYSDCLVMGAFAAIVTPVEYEVKAAGTVKIKKAITVTVPILNCSIKVTKEGPNAALSQVLFLNRPGGRILIHAEIGGINSLSSGEPCGPAGVEKTQGTYTGLLLALADSGATIDWHA